MGLYSGMSAGVAMDLWGFLVKDYLHISTRHYIDWTSGVLYGYLPANWYEFLFAFVAHLVWTGFLGIALSQLLHRSSSRHFLLKGTLFGFLIGFFIFGIAILLRMPDFTKIPFRTSITNATVGIIWGLVTAKLLVGFESRSVKKNDAH